MLDHAEKGTGDPSADAPASYGPTSSAAPRAVTDADAAPLGAPVVDAPAPDAPTPDAVEPSAEAAILRSVQRRVATPGVVTGARGLSHAGEHAAAWIAVGALGAVLDARRRRTWTTSLVGVVGAHAASVLLKRVVRRPRPHHPAIAVHVGTPSRLSFPSSHATSTTTAAILYGGMLGRTGVLAGGVLAGGMGFSRLVLGVHYPTDVLAGSALGAACAWGARRAVARGSIGRWRTS